MQGLGLKKAQCHNTLKIIYRTTQTLPVNCEKSGKLNKSHLSLYAEEVCETNHSYGTFPSCSARRFKCRKTLLVLKVCGTDVHGTVCPWPVLRFVMT